MALRPRVATHQSAALAERAAGALPSGQMAGSAIALCVLALSTTLQKIFSQAAPAKRRLPVGLRVKLRQAQLPKNKH